VDVLYTVKEEQSYQMLNMKINTEVKIHFPFDVPNHAWIKIIMTMRSKFASIRQTPVMVSGLEH